MTQTTSAQDDGDSLFWSGVGLSVVGLCGPSFLALFILVSALLHPNGWAYALFPLAVIAPACLIGAVSLLFAKRHRMSPQVYRHAWAVVGLAVLAGVSTITIIYHR